MSSEDPDDRDMASESGQSQVCDIGVSFVHKYELYVCNRCLLLLPSDLLESPSESLAKVRIPSRAALTHKLRKMKSKMVKCKQCDNYIVVNGVECEEVREYSNDARHPLLLRNTLSDSNMFVLISSDQKMKGVVSKVVPFVC